MQYPHVTLVVIMTLAMSLRSTSVMNTEESANEVEPPLRQQLRLVKSQSSFIREPRAIDIENRGTLDLLTTDGLMRCRERGKLELSLAKSYTVSDDQRTYLFEIRDAYWSDGKEITADDFERSWICYLENSDAGKKFKKCFATLLSSDQYGMNPRERFMINALDKKTLRVILSKPKKDFLAMLALPGFMLYRDYENSYLTLGTNPHIPICGPFRIRKQDSGALYFEKNQTYWDKENVRLDQIVVKTVDSPRKCVDLFLKKNVDFVSYPLGEIDYTSLLQMDTSERNIVIHTEQANITFWVELNTKSPFLKSVALRKALSHATNRSHLAWKLGSNKFKPSLTFLPTSCQVNPRFFPLTARAEQAQECLEEALEELDITKEELQLELIATSKDTKNDLSALFVESVQETLGIPIQLTYLPKEEYLKRVEAQDFDIICFHWAGYSLDPSCFLRPFRYSDPKLYQANYTSWHNLNFIMLYDRAQKCNNELTRTKLLSEAERVLQDELPIIPLLECSTDWLQSSQLKGFVITEPNIIDFKWAHFTP